MKAKILLFLFILTLYGCGYTSVYKDNSLRQIKFNYEIIQQNGNEEINQNIISSLEKYYDSSIKEKIEINIQSQFYKLGISNDKEGNTTAYQLTIVSEFDFILKNENKKIVLEESVNVNKSSDAFGQKSFETRIKKDISKLIVNRFINRLYLIK